MFNKQCWKGKKNGLRKVEVEVGDDMMTARNKDEIERMITKHNREHFSKVKNTKAHNEKTHESMNESKTRMQ